MNIISCADYNGMSSQAGELIVSEINKKRNLLFCAATGGSPEGLYRELVAESQENSQLFNQLRVLKLDEWGGVAENNPVTCEYYLQSKLLKPLDIPSERYISFSSDPIDPIMECNRIQNELDSHGPIDICILGLGKNGHLGLNEPADQLVPDTHVAVLSNESLEHDMVQSLERKPEYGLTLGMRDILSSQRIIMLISGKNKKEALDSLMSGKVSTQCPASFLWLHKNVDCFIDQSSIE